MTNHEQPQNHAQPGERGQGDDNTGASASGQAMQTPPPLGGAGGQGGTGQATPHHGLQESGGDAALNPSGHDRDLPMPGNGPTYQAGGTQQDREQRDDERKANESSGSSATNSSGAADPAPGTQGNQNP